jgi:hypothetical protein
VIGSSSGLLGIVNVNRLVVRPLALISAFSFDRRANPLNIKLSSPVDHPKLKIKSNKIIKNSYSKSLDFSARPFFGLAAFLGAALFLITFLLKASVLAQKPFQIE